MAEATYIDSRKNIIRRLSLQTSFKIWQIPATVAEVFKKTENRPKLDRPPKTGPKASVKNVAKKGARAK
jgi:hypothetical protein